MYIVSILFTYLSHQIHPFLLSSTVYPHNTPKHTCHFRASFCSGLTCPLVSFLMMFSSFRTGQSSRSSQAATQTLTFLLSVTQDVLLPLLKLTVYPNDLIYMLKVRPYCFQFSHTNSFHLFSTADSLSLTPMVKMELHCSQARTTEKQLPQMV